MLGTRFSLHLLFTRMSSAPGSSGSGGGQGGDRARIVSLGAGAHSLQDMAGGAAASQGQLAQAEGHRAAAHVLEPNLLHSAPQQRVSAWLVGQAVREGSCWATPAAGGCACQQRPCDVNSMHSLQPCCQETQLAAQAVHVLSIMGRSVVNLGLS